MTTTNQHPAGTVHDGDFHFPRWFVNEILGAKIGQELTISELEALPGGSIVVDLDGDAMQKSDTGVSPWYMAGLDAHETSFSAPELADATLLYVTKSKEYSA